MLPQRVAIKNPFSFVRRERVFCVLYLHIKFQGVLNLLYGVKYMVKKNKNYKKK